MLGTSQSHQPAPHSCLNQNNLFKPSTNTLALAPNELTVLLGSRSYTYEPSHKHPLLLLDPLVKDLRQGLNPSMPPKTLALGERAFYTPNCATQARMQLFFFPRERGPPRGELSNH